MLPHMTLHEMPMYRELSLILLNTTKIVVDLSKTMDTNSQLSSFSTQLNSPHDYKCPSANPCWFLSVIPCTSHCHHSTMAELKKFFFFLSPENGQLLCKNVFYLKWLNNWFSTPPPNHTFSFGQRKCLLLQYWLFYLSCKFIPFPLSSIIMSSTLSEPLHWIRPLLKLFSFPCPIVSPLSDCDNILDPIFSVKYLSCQNWLP